MRMITDHRFEEGGFEDSIQSMVRMAPWWLISAAIHGIAILVLWNIPFSTKNTGGGTKMQAEIPKDLEDPEEEELEEPEPEVPEEEIIEEPIETEEGGGAGGGKRGRGGRRNLRAGGGSGSHRERRRARPEVARGPPGRRGRRQVGLRRLHEARPRRRQVRRRGRRSSTTSAAPASRCWPSWARATPTAAPRSENKYAKNVRMGCAT